MPTNESELHAPRRTLGFCWIIYAIFRLIMGVVLILFTPTATVMFGALLSRVANPFALMSDFHLLYAAAIVLAFVSGVMSLAAGLALMSGASAARALSIVAAVLALSDLPLGTTIGTYTLVAVLPPQR